METVSVKREVEAEALSAEDLIAKAQKSSSMKGNPIVLKDEELAAILQGAENALA